LLSSLVALIIQVLFFKTNSIEQWQKWWRWWKW